MNTWFMGTLSSKREYLFGIVTACTVELHIWFMGALSSEREFYRKENCAIYLCIGNSRDSDRVAHIVCMAE